MAILKIAQRIYRTKIDQLLTRPELNEDYPHEFMRKMTDGEIKIFLDEIKSQLKTEGVSKKNPNHYNGIFNSLIQEREEIYQSFKMFENEPGYLE
jgi:hypothetical protein